MGSGTYELRAQNANRRIFDAALQEAQLAPTSLATVNDATTPWFTPGSSTRNLQARKGVKPSGEWTL